MSAIACIAAAAWVIAWLTLVVLGRKAGAFAEMRRENVVPVAFLGLIFLPLLLASLLVVWIDEDVVTWLRRGSR